MTTAFPGAVDVYTAKIDGTTVEAAKDINDLQDAMAAVETILINLVNAGRGTLGYAQVVANQTGISAQTDLTSLSTAVTVAAGRRIRISCFGLVQTTVANDSVDIMILEGATVLVEALAVLGVAGANGITALSGAVVLTPSTGAHTYKLALRRFAGTGTESLIATAANPAFILVEDVGV